MKTVSLQRVEITPQHAPGTARGSGFSLQRTSSSVDRVSEPNFFLAPLKKSIDTEMRMMCEEGGFVHRCCYFFAKN